MRMTAATIKKRVLAIYEDKNPTKLGDVPKLMTKYKGKETALYNAIVEKYEIAADYFEVEDAALAEHLKASQEAETQRLADQADPAEAARRRKVHFTPIRSPFVRSASPSRFVCGLLIHKREKFPGGGREREGRSGSCDLP